MLNPRLKFNLRLDSVAQSPINADRGYICSFCFFSSSTLPAKVGKLSLCCKSRIFPFVSDFLGCPLCHSNSVVTLSVNLDFNMVIFCSTCSVSTASSDDVKLAFLAFLCFGALPPWFAAIFQIISKL